MLDKEISVSGNDNNVVNDVKNSTINIGMTYTEVKDLCQTLIAAEVGRLTLEAEEDFKKRLEEFERRLYEKLAQMEAKENIEKLKKPSIQLCLHQTILSSMKTDDELTIEQLQEMLIDRLNVDENTTDRAIIEDAIEKATKISKPLMALMVALQFRIYIMAGSVKQALDYSFGQIGEMFGALDGLTNLDIAYGNQLQCLTSLPIYNQAVAFEDILLSNYDLYFRHSIRFGQYKEYRDAHPEIQHAVKLSNIEGMAMICIDGSKLDVAENDREVTLLASSVNFLKTALREQGKEYMIPALDGLLELMPVYTKEEMKAYLIGLNAGWAKLFEMCDKFKIDNRQLTPVGNYLSLVYARRITRLPNDFLKQIYECAVGGTGV